MKRYLLIAGSDYYPAQGTADWIDSFDSKEEIEAKIKTVTKISSVDPSHDYERYEIDYSTYDWYEIVDLENWTKDG